ncbi:MAG: molybdenum cofactor biosynthesis protein MoaE [Candidatus Thermoplasmatota archaeon]|jgi:molybdopterin synthase catalytic subunit|nr:molybdenum cofactor biosynthesis protein MoaE [Candidatus Thermoplasmatota archaeon]MCL5990069.1 molybdenum cofactor biosynthesis protein MoaE [Candidatus Thermoplasmatota archaeon]
MNVTIQKNKINVEELIEKTRSEKAGAIVTFQGTVRKFTDSTEVKSLFYESYPEMAVKLIRSIIDDAINKYKILDVNIIHRIGEVGLGEDSIAICVSSEHRKEAFLAGEYVINMIKEKAPIWKKDILASGESKWHN